MGPYLARRLGVSLLVLLLVSTATFVVFYLVPSTDPALLRAGRSGDPQVVATIREDLGLDRPVPVQYLDHLAGLVLQLDFGTSYATGESEPVLGLIVDRLPVTVVLTVGAAMLWLLVGIPAAVLSVTKPRSPGGRTVTWLSVLILCAPVYWLGLVALFLFSKDFGAVLPVAPGAGSYAPLADDAGRWLGSFVLPWIVLAISYGAIYVRLLRATLAETLAADFVRTAYAKGASRRRAVWRHGVRAAIVPVVTLLGVDLGALLGGAVLVETVFNLPGLGTLAFDAVRRGDLPVVQGTVLFGAIAVVLANLAVDLAYGILDPRVRVAGGPQR